MRALWSDRPNCSHNVSQKVKRIRHISEKSDMHTQRTQPCKKNHSAIANLLRVVNLLSHCDLLSRRAFRGHHFPGNYRHFSLRKKRDQGVLNTGAVVKTLRRSNSLNLAIVVALLVRKGPLLEGREPPLTPNPKTRKSVPAFWPLFPLYAGALFL